MPSKHLLLDICIISLIWTLRSPKSLHHVLVAAPIATVVPRSDLAFVRSPPRRAPRRRRSLPFPCNDNFRCAKHRSARSFPRSLAGCHTATACSPTPLRPAGSASVIYQVRGGPAGLRQESTYYKTQNAFGHVVSIHKMSAKYSDF